ncbi:MAG: 3-oxoacyl-[acyl-carrier-protein] reductase [Candidatus Wallbacteria bacterium]|nr:3-oxoacyl-[acyl-carrier-protein] reductase [Candidatus Wallbacteria bacterium]
MNFKDRVAVVTGGTRGIGKGIVRRLAALGAKVVVVGTNAETALQAAQELEKEFGIETGSFGCDVSNAPQVDGMIDSVAERFGRIDVLVNNAGIARDNLVLRMTDDEWDQVMNVNLKGMFHTTRKVLRHMLRQRSGSIVNITSVVGLAGNAGQANYCASKAGVIGFTKSVAKEFAAKGIRVNAVAPGFIATDMTRELPDKMKEELSRVIPMKRLGTADDVAPVVAFLASDDAAYITGQVLAVDGGMVM